MMLFRSRINLLLLLGVSVAVVVSTQTMAQTQFTRVYGGNGYDFGAEVIQTSDNGYLVAGESSSFDAGLSSQILLFKTDDAGYVEWRKTYGGSLADNAESMTETSDGHLLIGGITETATKSYQFYALKLTLTGDTVWTRKYGGQDWDLCKQVVALNDGGFAMIGETYSYGKGGADFFVVRADSNGDTLWTKTYGGEQNDIAESIALADDGGFFLAGHTESFGAGAMDMYVIRTDADGDTLWTETFGGPLDDKCFAVAATADGGYVLAGGTHNLTPDKADFLLRKEGGTQQWVQTESKGGDNYFTDVIIEPGTQNVTVVGYVTEGIFGGADGRILRFGADGIWNNVAITHGTQQLDQFNDVKLTSDFGYIMVGTTQGYLNRFDDVWLVKGNTQGDAVGPELDVDEIIAEDGASRSVAIFPNPAVHDCTFSIEDFDVLLSEIHGSISLRILAVDGKVVHSETLTSGQTQLSLSNYSSGLYFYQLVSDRGVVLATGKLAKTDG